jgi:protoheme IX farnesyltransferase
MPSSFLNTVAAYLELCKPRVVALMLITSLVGMSLSTHDPLPWLKIGIALLGIGCMASSAAVINHLVDERIDAIMWRTKRRPLPTGKIQAKHAMLFSIILSLIGFTLLFFKINALTAYLTLLSLIGYAGIYTLFLKRATPQNIVIGGIAGAAPPLLGWTAITDQISAGALILVAIIYTWTPPHFWALAIHRYHEYKEAKIPMLPVTHGIEFTKLHIVLYTFLLIATTFLPFMIGMSTLFYLSGVLVLDGIFLFRAILLWKSPIHQGAYKTFKYSIVYLFLLFFLLMLDHHLQTLSLKGYSLWHHLY